jgi:hypothetical protein
VELERDGGKVTVLTEDTSDGPPGRMSVASACGAFHVPSMRIRFLIKDLLVRGEN